MLANIFGFLMAFCFTVCYVPQIVKLLKNKTSKDVSVWYYVLCLAAYMFSLIYMFLTGFGIWWALNYGLGMAACSYVIYLCRKFK